MCILQQVPCWFNNREWSSCRTDAETSSEKSHAKHFLTCGASGGCRTKCRAKGSQVEVSGKKVSSLEGGKVTPSCNTTIRHTRWHRDVLIWLVVATCAQVGQKMAPIQSSSMEKVPSAPHVPRHRGCFAADWWENDVTTTQWRILGRRRQCWCGRTSNEGRDSRGSRLRSTEVTRRRGELRVAVWDAAGFDGSAPCFWIEVCPMNFLLPSANVSSSSCALTCLVSRLFIGLFSALLHP